MLLKKYCHQLLNNMIWSVIESWTKGMCCILFLINYIKYNTIIINIKIKKII